MTTNYKDVIMMKMHMKSAVIIGCLLIAGCKEQAVSNSDIIQSPLQPVIEQNSDTVIQDTKIEASQPVAKKQNEIETTEQKKDMQGIIDVQGVMLSAADYMLDFRYRVIDPDKATDILSEKHKPYLIDQATGAKLLMPVTTKIGPLRQTTLKPQKDRTYYVMFANPGRFIKRDSKVDVVIGDFIVRDIVVK